MTRFLLPFVETVMRLRFEVLTPSYYDCEVCLHCAETPALLLKKTALEVISRQRVSPPRCLKPVSGIGKSLKTHCNFWTSNYLVYHHEQNRDEFEIKSYLMSCNCSGRKLSHNLKFAKF